jgi:hypothetical protein
MKHVPFVVSFCALFAVSAERAAAQDEASSSDEALPAGLVSGSVASVSSYCGGPPPSEDLLRTLRTPAVRPGTKLLFRRGRRNAASSPIAAEVTSDAEGRFTVDRLAPGTYCIVEDVKRTFRLPRYGALVAKRGCYASWFATCDATFSLGKKHGERVSVEIDLGCESGATRGQTVCVPFPPRP